MASFKAHAVSFLLRHTMKRKLSKADDVQGVRKIFNAHQPRLSRSLRTETRTLGGVAGEWLERPGQEGGRFLLYLHGGGYVACSPVTHRPITSHFARVGFHVFAPDYRLAPEHPFPAALDYALTAYTALRALAGREARICVAGDSAGGGLALALLIKLRDQGLEQPEAAVLFSPLTDMTGTGRSAIENDRKCAMFRRDSIGKIAPYYTAGQPADMPLISPLFADLHSLPPLLIHVGRNEVLRDDSVRLAEKAQAAGTSVTLKIWDAVPHDWQLFHRVMPEGRQSLNEATAFLTKAVP
jgi:acetyl esterase/lipase